MQNGVSTIIIPASPKWKDLLRLDEVPRKRRKFLDASTTVTEGYLPQLPVVELAKPVVVSMTEAQLALPALELVMEAASLAVQEASLEMLEAQSPTLMIQGILGELNPTGETVDAPDAVEEEEEGSSSNPEKRTQRTGRPSVLSKFSIPRPINLKFLSPLMLHWSWLRLFLKVRVSW